MSVTIRGTDNSAATPAVSGTDGDTGLYFPAANQLALATGGTQAVFIDSSQRVGIGTSSPATPTHIQKASGNTYYRSQNNVGFVDVGVDGAGNAIFYNNSNLPMTFGTNDTERMRINADGYMLWNTTSPNFSTIGNGNVMSIRGSMVLGINDFGDAIGFGLVSKINASAAGGGGWPLYCLNSSGTQIGGIFNSGGTSTAFQTSSDYRLKQNQAPLTGSGAFIDALKPTTWTWILNGEKASGFIAHEVQEVSPSSVVGKKDEVDEKGQPKYQSMEYGSADFIANIIAELQDLRKRVALLESN